MTRDNTQAPPGQGCGECSSEAVSTHLRKILSSEEFSHAAGPGRLLRFTVEETLQGRTNQIKEYTLGVAVFDRGDGFDPRLDSIVRVQARRLRAKLSRYYETEGRLEPVRIEYPKGGYVPIFRKPDAASPAVREDRPALSIAVLPFADLSAGQDQAYFSDGLSEELIHCLSQLPGLNVMARGSVAHFKSGNADFREIGTRLNVQFVLEGSVRCAGPALRVAVRLVNVASGFTVWSTVYERRMEDLFAIQEEIARSVSMALQPRLSPDAPASANSSRRTENLEVYDLYLRGRHLWNQLGPKSVQRSIEYFQEALRIDNRYAPAYAGLADAYITLAGSGFVAPREVMPPAREASLRAIELDDRLAEAHASLAKIAAEYDWDEERAELSYRRALRVNPGYANAHHWYGICLASAGRLQEAFEEVEVAQKLDPLSPGINWSLGHMLEQLGRKQEALKQYLRANDLIPFNPDTFHYLALGAAQRGLFAQIRLAKEMGYTLPPVVDAGVLAGEGRHGEARELLQAMEGELASHYIPPLALAHGWLASADYERALDWFERAFVERQFLLLNLDQNPVCAVLHGHPRFRQLLDSIRRERRHTGA